MVIMLLAASGKMPGLRSGGHRRSRPDQCRPSDKLANGGSNPCSLPEDLGLAEAIALCALPILMVFLPLLLGLCALPDWSERAPVTEHECVVLSADISCLTTGTSKSCYTTRYVPVVQVHLVVSNTTHLAMRYRKKRCPFDGSVPDYSKFDRRDEAEAFLRKFPIGGSVSCYQFEDGTVKLQEDQPELMFGTHLFYFLSVLAGGLVCFLACSAIARRYCRARTIDEHTAPNESNTDASTSHLEAGHGDTVSTCSTCDTVSRCLNMTQIGRPHIETEV
jgi:hypothetical protein